jgi:hypothetical protein
MTPKAVAILAGQMSLAIFRIETPSNASRTPLSSLRSKTSATVMLRRTALLSAIAIVIMERLFEF